MQLKKTERQLGKLETSIVCGKLYIYQHGGTKHQLLRYWASVWVYRVSALDIKMGKLNISTVKVDIIMGKWTLSWGKWTIALGNHISMGKLDIIGKVDITEKLDIGKGWWTLAWGKTETSQCTLALESGH